MPLIYSVDNKLQKMAPVMDDHAEWFGQTVRRIFYPEYYADKPPLQRPDTFHPWLNEAASDDFLDKSVLQGLDRLHAELHQMADKLLVTAAEAKPEVAAFESFENLYEGFMTQLHRLQNDIAQTDNGLDPTTGVRNKRTMVTEIERELERRSRHGRPFCLALAKVDEFDLVKSLVSEEKRKEILATVGRLIRKCIRSFDDAYRSGEAEFVMCLKHAETSGGTATINRLRTFLNQEKIMIEKGDGTSFQLTMSYCLAEPVPGDTLDDLMSHMSKDLERYKEQDRDTALEYREQSPLARMLKDIDAVKR